MKQCRLLNLTQWPTTQETHISCRNSYQIELYTYNISFKVVLYLGPNDQEEEESPPIRYYIITSDREQINSPLFPTEAIKSLKLTSV